MDGLGLFINEQREILKGARYVNKQTETTGRES